LYCLFVGNPTKRIKCFDESDEDFELGDVNVELKKELKAEEVKLENVEKPRILLLSEHGCIQLKSQIECVDERQKKLLLALHESLITNRKENWIPDIIRQCSNQELPLTFEMPFLLELVLIYGHEISGVDRREFQDLRTDLTSIRINEVNIKGNVVLM